jgi:hypothetical protein
MCDSDALYWLRKVLQRIKGVGDFGESPYARILFPIRTFE